MAAVDTARALGITRRGSADVLFVHHNATFEKIVGVAAVFASRGDGSGTRKIKLENQKDVGVAAEEASDT